MRASSGDRRARGEGSALELTFVGIEEAKITAAEIDGGFAKITVHFVSDLISATRDKDGEVVEGDPTEVQTIRDAWTFARERSPAIRTGSWSPPKRSDRPSLAMVQAPKTAWHRRQLAGGGSASESGILCGYRRLARRRPRRGACLLLRSSAEIAETTAEDTRVRHSGRGAARPGARALALGPAAPAEEARAFFERGSCRTAIGAEGFVTGYFEPEVDASRTPDARFSVPLYRRPHDLVEIGDADRPPGWDPEIRFARARRRRPRAAFRPRRDRRRSARRTRPGARLCRDPVDAFFIHVQGSARLRLARRIDDADRFRRRSRGTPTPRSAGLPSSAASSRATAPTRTDWKRGSRRNRAAGLALMRENRSFIFFREIEHLGDADGPLGAAGVPLTAGRSLAVDRTLIPFTCRSASTSPALADPARPDRPFRRLMIAQDTGSAILGPARGDLFIGSGSDGRLARRQRPPRGANGRPRTARSGAACMSRRLTREDRDLWAKAAAKRVRPLRQRPAEPAEEKPPAPPPARGESRSAQGRRIAPAAPAQRQPAAPSALARSRRLRRRLSRGLAEVDATHRPARHAPGARTCVACLASCAGRRRAATACSWSITGKGREAGEGQGRPASGVFRAGCRAPEFRGARSSASRRPAVVMAAPARSTSGSGGARRLDRGRRQLGGVAFRGRAVIIDVARAIDDFRQDDADVGRAELPVDHRAVADERAEAEIALDQRRQRARAPARASIASAGIRFISTCRCAERGDAPFLRRPRRGGAES